MIAETPVLGGLRRSVLGAWLAVIYALAVLASGLAPSPASALAPLEGALLCSGLTPPGPDAPEPTGEPAHCKGCPVNPILAGPGQAAAIAIFRAWLYAASAHLSGFAALPAATLGLPQSRAPPQPLFG